MALFKKILNCGIPYANKIPTLLSRNNLLAYGRYVMVSQRSIEKKLDIPSKPKRPLTPFIKFSINQRPILRSKYPEKSVTELMTIMAEAWRAVDQDEKDRMRSMYKAELNEYTNQIMNYDMNLSNEQKKMIKAERSRRLHVEERNKKKSRLLDLGRPKKPPTPFVLYMVSRLNSRPKEGVFSHWLSIVANDWKNLPPEDKVATQQEAKKLMEQYQKDVLLWETRMIKMGHIDVVRKRALLSLKSELADKSVENQT